MASPFIKFDCLARDVGLGVHDFNADTIEVYLSNTAPDVATDQVKADLPEIATGHGYTGPVDIQNSYTETGGIGTMTGVASITLTASGGSIGPFRYIVMCNASKTGSPLIAYYDYGSTYTMNDGTTFSIGFDPVILRIQ